MEGDTVKTTGDNGSNGSQIPQLPLMQIYSHGEVQKLTGRHHEILRFYAMGMSRKEIAIHLGISEPTVTNITKSFLGKRELIKLFTQQDEKALDAKTVILANQKAAADTLVSALGATTKGMADWRVRIDAANKILNKGEHPDKKVEVSRAEIELSVKEKIEKIKELATNAGSMAEVEELEYQDVSGSDITSEEETQ